MKCVTCGSDNEEDSKFCRHCGVSLDASRAVDSAYQEAAVKDQEDTDRVSTHRVDSSYNEVEIPEPEDTGPIPIPDDAVVVRQSQWAYLLHTIPWLVLLGLSFIFDFFTFGILPTAIATYIIWSRYLSFRRTTYILTEHHIIVVQGSLLGQNRIDISFTDVDRLSISPGIFGRSLGYTGVNMQLSDRRIVPLSYIPITAPLVDHIQARVILHSPN